MIGLTPRQALVLRYLQGRTEPWGPSFTEIGAAVGISNKSVIHWLLKQLEARGFIRRLPGKERAIELIPQTVTIRGERYRFIAKSRAA